MSAVVKIGDQGSPFAEQSLLKQITPQQWFKMIEAMSYRAQALP